MSDYMKQDANVVSGKGMTRRGFLGLGALTGVAAAGLSLAGCAPTDTSASATASGNTGGYSFETNPGDIAESSIAETREYDVVVVGAGAAGLSVAASAAEEGAKAICIEKTAASSGAGTYYGFINTDLMAANGVAHVDEDTYAHDLIEADLGACVPALVRKVVASSAKVGNWIASLASQTGNQAMFSAEMGSENTVYFDDTEKNSSAYGMLSSYGTSKGGEYVYSTEVVRIERGTDGRVSGVIAKGDSGSYTRYKAAKGVILATGGYNGDLDMVAKYIPWLDTNTTIEYSPISTTGNTGDGLKMALWSGARIGSTPHCPMVHYISGAMPMAGSLFVNKSGKRFMDEGTSMEVIAQISMRQPGHVMFNITDAKPSAMALMTGGPSAGMSSSSTAPTYDTIDALAEANGFDAATLNATVARWNEMVAAGVDSDFGSNLATAQTLDTPPYSCTEGKGCRLAMMGGPQIDENMQVVDTDHVPIPGLYAAGNCSSGMFGPNYPMQVQSGIARAFCTISGYTAAKSALGN